MEGEEEVSKFTPTDDMTIDYEQDGDTAFTFKHCDVGEIRFMTALEESVAFVTRSWWRRTLFNFAGGGRVVAKAPTEEK